MRKLLVAAVLVALLLGADQAARVVTERRLAERARQAATVQSAWADISSFPFLGRIFWSGTVREVHVRVTGVQAGPLRLTAVRVDAWGVRLKRDFMFGGRVQVEAIERGMVTVELDGPALSDALHVPVYVEGDRVRVGRGVAVAAAVRVDRRGTLTLEVAGLPTLTVPAWSTPLVPCTATMAGIVGDRVRLACSVDQLPALLRG